MRFAAFVLVALALLGCETVDYVDRSLNESTPTNPVTGAPLINIVNEKTEIAEAQHYWQEMKAEAAQQSIAIDQPGRHYQALQRVFPRLVDVSHRRGLPWQVHLVGSPEVNAFTAGGGVAVVFEGLFGNLIPDGDDDALAAALAHEIAHVNLLHVPKSTTWQMLGPLASKKNGRQVLPRRVLDRPRS